MIRATDTVPDSERRGLIGALPAALRPYASLMRLDRPIGTWLLYWPCAWSVALAGVRGEWVLFAWLGLGAFAMRSAGCVYNDIVDRDLDRQVERTRLRPDAPDCRRPADHSERVEDCDPGRGLCPQPPRARLDPDQRVILDILDRVERVVADYPGD